MANYVDMNTNNKTTNYGGYGYYTPANTGRSAKEVVGTIFKVIGIVVAAVATLGFALIGLAAGVGSIVTWLH